MKRKMIILTTIILFLMTGIIGCNDDMDLLKGDDDLRWEISPDSDSNVIETKVNGIAFKFCLLNEQGEPATVFKDGENFTFYFQIKNETGKNFYYNAYECCWHNDFFTVMNSSGEEVGKSYEALNQSDIGIVAYPFSNNDSYTFKVPWIHPDESIVMGGNFGYRSIIREPLKSGNYYTEFVNNFKMFDLPGNEDIETGELHFKINFNVQ